MTSLYDISSASIDLDAIARISKPHTQLRLSEESQEAIRRCRSYLDEKLRDSGALFYGINTGFGSLCHIAISKDEIETLQSNLVQSHACGLGDEVPHEVVRLMLFLKIQSLSYGYSGVCLALVQRLVDFFNLGILPIVYEQGSLGASGDLAPLAHLSLPLLGLGEVAYQGKRRVASEVLNELHLAPLHLKSKEGLALLNGTQFSCAYGGWCLLKAQHLFKSANLCAALSIDAFDGLRAAFDERLHRIRPHAGQQLVAEAIRFWLKDSELSHREKAYIQDPYAFRCVPQVHGASWDAIDYVKRVVTTEMNSVTDNPNIFPETDDILSGGNFHAQPLALALDFLAIALAELGSISERRTFQLIAGNRELPGFLVQNPGLNSGLMIPQYTAASIVSQNKQLCTPASVDSIVSSNGQEDHVSMAANAATKAYRVVNNLERLLAIEFMTAAQALVFRRPAKTSPVLESILSAYRKRVTPLEEDRILRTDIQNTIAFLQELEMEAYF
ncbi:MAG TPA: histidine ammonia-lyase [Saprospiraceae bacterium]|nr:histidine ammonia-lyase [Saprospiraceae bacterium]HMQ82903.1 histidine ammonia-lyase [Saprospiraceae bacterium]